jgi:N utilization substance protein B
MSQQNKIKISPRIRVIQKLYGNLINPEEIIEYPKSRFKKFIKDVVEGTIERNEFIEDTIQRKIPDDLNLKKTDKILKIIIFAAVFELLFKHNNPSKVIISEYVKASEYFVETIQTKYLNAILDKISRDIRNETDRI